MEFFQIVQKNHAIIGICPNQTEASYKRIKITFFLFGLSVLLSTVFLCREANTFLEYSNSLYVTTAVTMVTIIYAISIFKMSKLFEYIYEFRKLVEQSRFTGLDSRSIK